MPVPVVNQLRLTYTGVGPVIRVVTDSRDIIEGQFLGFNEKTCCVTIKVAVMMTPPVPGEVTFVDCGKIESISFLTS